MRLEEYRKIKNLTYDELAACLNFKRSTTYNICHGKGCITLANAYKVMSVTKGAVSYADLLAEMEDC